MTFDTQGIQSNIRAVNNDLNEAAFNKGRRVVTLPPSASFASCRPMWTMAAVIAGAEALKDEWERGPDGHYVFQDEGKNRQLCVRLRGQDLTVLKDFNPTTLSLHLLFSVYAAAFDPSSGGFILEHRDICHWTGIKAGGNRERMMKVFQSLVALNSLLIRVDSLRAGKGEDRVTIKCGVHVPWVMLVRLRMSDGTSSVKNVDEWKRASLDWSEVDCLAVHVTPGQWAHQLLVIGDGTARHTAKIPTSILSWLPSLGRLHDTTCYSLVYLVYRCGFFTKGPTKISGRNLMNLAMGFKADGQRSSAVRDSKLRLRAANRVDRLLRVASQFFEVEVHEGRVLQYATVVAAPGKRFTEAKGSTSSVPGSATAKSGHRRRGFYGHYLEAMFKFRWREVEAGGGIMGRESQEEWLELFGDYAHRSGLKQREISRKLGKSEAWVQRRLSGAVSLSEEDRGAFNEKFPGFEA